MQFLRWPTPQEFRRSAISEFGPVNVVDASATMCVFCTFFFEWAHFASETLEVYVCCCSMNWSVHCRQDDVSQIVLSVGMDGQDDMTKDEFIT